MKPKIAIVVAKAANNMIGCSEGLPWRIPEELKYFKDTTIGKPVIMGRRTYESLGKPLPGRTNIVLTRKTTMGSENVIYKSSLTDAIKIARRIAKRDKVDEIMIIGGSEIFKQALPIADKVYLTKIHENFAGNAELEGFNEEDWKTTKTTSHFYPETKILKKTVQCEFLVLERKKKSLPELISTFIASLTTCEISSTHQKIHA